MRAYNLFRLKDGPGSDGKVSDSEGSDGQGREELGLCCAVPENRAVPDFVTGRRWTFGGRIDERSTGTPGFDGRLAATAVRFNGFYLFQPLDVGGQAARTPPREDPA